MKYEKAIGWMIVRKHCIIECPDDANDTSEEIIEAYNMAIEALQKQMPQKVMWETDYTWGIANKMPVCPSCENGLTKVLFISDAADGGKRVTYCQTCGQAISWED
jgi:hypothetical protein